MTTSLPCKIVFKHITIDVASDHGMPTFVTAEVHPLNQQIPNPPTIKVAFAGSASLRSAILKELTDQTMKCFNEACHRKQ